MARAIKIMVIAAIPCLVFILAFAKERIHPVKVSEKLNGVNFVAPARAVDSTCYNGLERINSKWIALNPFSYGKPGSTELSYDITWQWWGERTEGVEKMLGYANSAGLKVMIKPHIWVRGQGWAGDFTLENDKDWRAWEKNYTSYIMTYANLAAKYNVEVLCIGTELKQSVQKRPEFWQDLIKQIKSVYNGKLTYAANWDNYQNVPFWKEVDYIGIDSYFPVSEEAVPQVKDMVKTWEPIKNEIANFSAQQERPILFTEFGYRSIEQTAWQQWVLPEHWESGGQVNLLAQVNAYSAIFKTFWDESWFAGGFIWKWYANDHKAGGSEDRDYTPQHKPVERLIHDWYNADLQ